jgi:hypothetical protein
MGTKQPGPTPPPKKIRIEEFLLAHLKDILLIIAGLAIIALLVRLYLWT